MKKIILLLVFSVVSFFVTYAQKTPSAQITNYEVLDNGKKIKLFYKVQNAYKNEKYNIKLVVTRTSGTEVSSDSISGDVLNVKPSGKEKSIVWNLMADKVFLSEELNFEIKINYDYDYSYYDLKTLMLKSAVFPGWGINTVNHKIAPLSIGFFTYSFIGLSIVSEQLCLYSYNNYLKDFSYYSREDKYSYAQLLRKGTYAFAGAAVLTWSYGMLQTYLTYNKANNKANNSQINSQINVSFYPKYNSVFGQPEYSLAMSWVF